MELTAAVVSATVDLIEAPTPVYTEQTEHRQEESDTDTGGALEIEGIILLDIREAVSGFQETENPNGRILLQGDGVAHLDGKFIIDITQVTSGVRIVRRE